MAYNITITKSDIFDDEGEKISLEEWRNVVDADPSLIWVEDLQNNRYNLLPPPKTAAEWFENPDDVEGKLLFELLGGEITFGYGNDPDRMWKILDVAKRLNAFVQADNGDIIDENTPDEWD